MKMTDLSMGITGIHGLRQQPPYQHVRIMQFKADNSTLNVEQRTVSGWASTPEEDSYGDVVLPTAFTSSLSRFMENPVVYWNHMWNSIPIGKITFAEVRSQGLWVTVQFGTTSLAQEVWTAVAIDGTVRSMSIGFNGDYTPEFGYWNKDGNVWVWTDLQLVEVSVVGLPACHSAQFQLSRSLGLLPNSINRGIIGQLPVAATDMPWDLAGSEKRTIEWAMLGGKTLDRGKYAKRFLWGGDVEEDTPLLPIADVVDGELRMVWEGVATSMCQLLGARGGVELGVSAKRQMFHALCACYARFGKTVPEWDPTVPWPASFHEVTFRSGEKEVLDAVVASDNARRVRQAATSLASIARHMAKTTGVKPELVSDAARSIVELTGVLSSCRAGDGIDRALMQEAKDAMQQGVQEIDRLCDSAATGKKETFTLSLK